MVELDVMKPLKFFVEPSGLLVRVKNLGIFVVCCFFERHILPKDSQNDWNNVRPILQIENSGRRCEEYDERSGVTVPRLLCFLLSRLHIEPDKARQHKSRPSSHHLLCWIGGIAACLLCTPKQANTVVPPNAIDNLLLAYWQIRVDWTKICTQLTYY